MLSLNLRHISCCLRIKATLMIIIRYEIFGKQLWKDLTTNFNLNTDLWWLFITISIIITMSIVSTVFWYCCLVEIRLARSKIDFFFQTLHIQGTWNIESDGGKNQRRSLEYHTILDYVRNWNKYTNVYFFSYTALMSSVRLIEVQIAGNNTVLYSKITVWNSVKSIRSHVPIFNLVNIIYRIQEYVRDCRHSWLISLLDKKSKICNQFSLCLNEKSSSETPYLT